MRRICTRSLSGAAVLARRSHLLRAAVCGTNYSTGTGTSSSATAASRLAIAGAVALSTLLASSAVRNDADPSSPAAPAAALVAPGHHGPIMLTRDFVADAASLAAPSVVHITSVVKGGFMPVGSAGSGFIISDDGYIVTNAHVVPGGPNAEVLVTLPDYRKYPGFVHSVDTVSDIAIVKVNVPGESLPVALLGSSGSLRAGEFVIALGSPLQLQNSVSFGIVSAIARHGSEMGMSQNRTGFIQTDAAINVGNSGGPLLNMDGEVVGINNMKAQGVDGISFAIPIDTANQVITQLLKNKRVIRPYIGISMTNYIPDKKGKSKLPPAFQAGDTLALIQEVQRGSPAEAAGLMSGDIIVAVDGKRVVSGIPDILSCIGLDVGRKIELKIRRKPDLKDKTIVITTAPEK